MIKSFTNQEKTLLQQIEGVHIQEKGEALDQLQATLAKTSHLLQSNIETIKGKQKTDLDLIEALKKENQTLQTNLQGKDIVIVSKDEVIQSKDQTIDLLLTQVESLKNKILGIDKMIIDLEKQNWDKLDPLPLEDGLSPDSYKHKLDFANKKRADYFNRIPTNIHTKPVFEAVRRTAQEVETLDFSTLSKHTISKPIPIPK
ncbi:MAG: hypothetical protein BGO10_06620 [Chlamydia sp. 32-24]|nr:MAG: hypothetical protein BGO10_06620 [Chlamydia sp. 32-24]